MTAIASTTDSQLRCNVADRLSAFAESQPDRVAIAVAKPGKRGVYQTITFGDLDSRVNAIANGLLRRGVVPGTRFAMLVPFGIDFICLVLALLKAGMIQILVDPGMGKQNLIECLAASKPQGFIGIPKAQIARLLYRKRFPDARQNFVVGSRFALPLLGVPIDKVRVRVESKISFPLTCESDPAAVIFTTGSTGPPKGVAYTHGTFEHQVRLIQRQYQIQPGTVDLACFPLFGLFDAVMGVTTVVPDMDPTRPADAKPDNIISAVRDWRVDQAFGSPALWHTVSSYCVRKEITLPSVRRVLSAGAPVPPATLNALRKMMHPDVDVYTPYGATESLPVASIESREVLNETAKQTLAGAGTCVGKRFDEMEWQVIRITDDPLDDIAQVDPLPTGQIGELMVSGPVVTSAYVTRPDQNALHKVRDGKRVWHRMGDVGYLDADDRFWFCGRKAHRVQDGSEVLYTICCEAIFNQHDDVYRTALIGIGDRPRQTPMLIVEPHADRRPENEAQRERLIQQLRELGKQFEHTRRIERIEIHPLGLPVDIRHNSKIFREKLVQWYRSR
ncbi:MAG: fatty acid CoA ligase family protein [Pirellulaceae bacterium]